jgi:hypothetical protein
VWRALLQSDPHRRKLPPGGGPHCCRRCRRALTIISAAATDGRARGGHEGAAPWWGAADAAGRAACPPATGQRGSLCQRPHRSRDGANLAFLRAEGNWCRRSGWWAGVPRRDGVGWVECWRGFHKPGGGGSHKPRQHAHPPNPPACRLSRKLDLPRNAFAPCFQEGTVFGLKDGERDGRGRHRGHGQIISRLAALSGARAWQQAALFPPECGFTAVCLSPDAAGPRQWHGLHAAAAAGARPLPPLLPWACARAAP